MPKVKNVSGGPRLLAGRRVDDGEVIEVAAGEVYGLTCQLSNWAPDDAAAKKAHKDADEAQIEANNPSRPEVPVESQEAVEADTKEND